MSIPSTETRNPNPAVDLSYERTLMAYIRGRWGALLDEVCKSSSVPPEFLAGLIANESGGKEYASRFEKSLYNQLVALRAGAVARVWSVHRAQINGWSDDQLRDLATSWGLAQILGLNVIGELTGQQLCDPRTNLVEALKMLAKFCEGFQLDPRVEFEAMLRCWNTGNPEGETFDPHYVENGERRLVIYRDETKAS